MIYITGDTHGEFNRFNTERFPQQEFLSKKDYVIICGDFGLIWDNSKMQKWWTEWLKKKNITFLFCDGNHSNFNRLNKYPIEIWNEGKVHKITDNIIHLMRGQVFYIDNKKFFTFGGANSIDKIYRTPNISWWEEEMPNNKEYEEGLKNLEINNFEVDYIISHTCSSNTLMLLSKLYSFHPDEDSLTKYFNLIEEKVKFKHWYFGHFHQDLQILDNQTVVYEKMLKLE